MQRSGLSEHANEDIGQFSATQFVAPLPRPRFIRRFIAALERAILGHDVFVSYARRDGAEYAAALARRLTEANIDCYFDQRGTPADPEPPEELRKALRRSFFLVVITTKGAKRSRWVFQEIREFSRWRKSVIPLGLVRRADRNPWTHLTAGVAVTLDIHGGNSGVPSSMAVERIIDTVGWRSKNRRLRVTFLSGLVLLALIIAVSAERSRFYWRQAKAAGDQVRVALQNLENERGLLAKARKERQRIEESLDAANMRRLAIEAGTALDAEPFDPLMAGTLSLKSLSLGFSDGALSNLLRAMPLLRQMRQWRLPDLKGLPVLAFRRGAALTLVVSEELDTPVRLRLQNLKNGKQVLSRRLKQTGYTFLGIPTAVDSAGDWLAVYDRGSTSLKVWSTSRPSVAFELPYSVDSHISLTLTFSKDCLVLAWQTETGARLVSWDFRAGITNTRDYPWAFKHVATAGNYIAFSDRDVIHFVQAKTLAEGPVRQLPFTIHGISFSADGLKFVAAGPTGSAVVYDLLLRRTFTIHPKRQAADALGMFPTSVSMSPDGGIVATVNAYSEYCLVQAWSTIPYLRAGGAVELWRRVFIAERNIRPIVTASANGMIFVATPGVVTAVDLRSNPAHRFVLASSVFSLAFSKDGSELRSRIWADGGRFVQYRWNIGKAELRGPETAPRARLQNFMFDKIRKSPLGVWEIRGVPSQMVLAKKTTRLKVNAPPVLDAQPSDDGHYLLWADTGLAGVIETATGKDVFMLPLQDKGVAVAFSPDRRWAAIAEYNSVEILPWCSENVIQIACTLLLEASVDKASTLVSGELIRPLCEQRSLKSLQSCEATQNQQ